MKGKMPQIFINKLFLFIYFIIIFLSIETRSSISEYLEPILEFKEKIARCFGPLELKRQQIKKALYNFMREVLSDGRLEPSPKKENGTAKTNNSSNLTKDTNITDVGSNTNKTEQSKESEERDTIILRSFNEPSDSHEIASKAVFNGSNGNPKLLLWDAELDSKITASELISTHGFKVETHTVVTVDGYKLSINRILTHKERFSASGSKVALLHHGLLGSSMDWLLLGPNKSLPYMLSEHGYDVWLTNARGNKYSRNHVNMNTDSKEFWDFSWHEIGHLDMSAVIDYIRERTHKKSLIHFIGHSMGATALLVLLSTVPHYSLYLNSAILLAPLSFLFQVKGPLRYIAEGKNIGFLGNKEFVSTFPDYIVKQFCKGEELCSNPWLLMANGGIDSNIQGVLASVIEQTPGGGSTKTVLHYAQLIQSGLFQRFDYGPVKNLLVYGKSSPPEYALNEISSPLVLISSPGDWLSSTRDVETLSAHLTCDITHHVIKRPGFSHIDFLWADDAPQLVYKLVINLLQEIKEKSEALMV